MAVIPVVAVFLRNSPAEIGLTPYGADETYEPPSVLTNPVSAAFSSLRDAANEHMTMLEKTPERVMGYFQDRRVRYAAAA